MNARWLFDRDADALIREVKEGMVPLFVAMLFVFGLAYLIYIKVGYGG